MSRLVATGVPADPPAGLLTLTRCRVVRRVPPNGRSDAEGDVRWCIIPLVARKRVNFYLDDELLIGLKALKARIGVPESETVRRAIAEYLARHQTKPAPTHQKAPSRKR